jgi:cell division protein FtsQ
LFALTSGRNVGSAGRARRGGTFAPDSFVLPKLLRRPARFAARVWSGEVVVPQFAALALSSLLVGSFVMYGVAVGGHTPAVVQAVTARTGFAIDEIRVSGNLETSEIDIFDRVGLDGWTSLVGFDVEEARERIATLPWVESTTVRKIYPSTLEVKVVEKVPFAVWQQGSLLSLVERNGAVIAPLVGTRHASLPLVVGAGGAEPAASFLSVVASYPELASRVLGYVRVADRRWDLRMANGITVKLPEFGAARALTDLVELDRIHQILERDIESLDMRFGDRLVVKLSEDAAVARETALKELLGRNYKPVERSI